MTQVDKLILCVFYFVVSLANRSVRTVSCDRMYVEWLVCVWGSTEDALSKRACVHCELYVAVYVCEHCTVCV